MKFMINGYQLGEFNMINEQDKQAILNGSFGVSRDGSKCKFIGKLYTPDPYNYFFVYFNKVGITNYESLNEDFLENPSSESPLDVVGLWENRQEPFNLDKALQGEPVLLRDGLKAYIRYISPPEYTGNYILNGYIINPDEPDGITFEQWTIAGKEFNDNDEHEFDIISMWKDPEPNRVTLTLPCPLKEPKDGMWFIGSEGSIIKSAYKKDDPDFAICESIFNAGFYFGSEAEAQEWLDAMKNNRR